MAHPNYCKCPFCDFITDDGFDATKQHIAGCQHNTARKSKAGSGSAPASASSALLSDGMCLLAIATKSIKRMQV